MISKGILCIQQKKNGANNPFDRQKKKNLMRERNKAEENKKKSWGDGWGGGTSGMRKRSFEKGGCVGQMNVGSRIKTKEFFWNISADLQKQAFLRKSPPK
jgi:hypothetical protein